MKNTDLLRSTMQDCFYATNRFDTLDCTQLTDNLLLYLKEAGFIIIHKDEIGHVELQPKMCTYHGYYRIDRTYQKNDIVISEVDGNLYTSRENNNLNNNPYTEKKYWKPYVATFDEKD